MQSSAAFKQGFDPHLAKISQLGYAWQPGAEQLEIFNSQAAKMLLCTGVDRANLAFWQVVIFQIMTNLSCVITWPLSPLGARRGVSLPDAAL